MSMQMVTVPGCSLRKFGQLVTIKPLQRIRHSLERSCDLFRRTNKHRPYFPTNAAGRGAASGATLAGAR